MRWQKALSSAYLGQPDIYSGTSASRTRSHTGKCAPGSGQMYHRVNVLGQGDAMCVVNCHYLAHGDGVRVSTKSYPAGENDSQLILLPDKEFRWLS
jgi:hypothetical protein